MRNWSEILADADDDYLIGLSNKGIVKRAYKDKEEAAGKVEEISEEATVKVGEETVTVCVPLGESKCTCPSRSICRHVIQAILVLKESVGTVQDAKEDAGIKEEGAPAAGEEAIKAGEATAKAEEATDKVLKEIKAYSFTALKKTLGSRQFHALAAQAAAGMKPEIQYSSVITVRLSDPEFVVKLLSPLEYSSCTCHKKEMCTHKAAAILWCQLNEGVLTQADLTEEEEGASYDMEKVKEAAGQMKSFLEELLSTGLSRTSPDALDYLERLAIISHNAGLARFEGYFRALSDSYDRYFKRKAAFRTEMLMMQIARLYRRVGQLIRAKDANEVLKYAGEFKAEYALVGNLDLIGVAMERFQSQTGYEGETIYFLEENTKNWYTYTNARPSFYDTAKRRHAEKSQAPWGLNIAMEDLLKVRIHLTGAKCDDRRRLSSSQETKGEIIKEQKLTLEDVKGWYYSDFSKIFPEQIGKQQKGWLFEEAASKEGVDLVIIQPDSCAEAEFSQTGQQLTLPLYDKAGREIIIEVTYSKEESSTIRYLERISKKKLPCFIGKIYLRDGRIRMYPVDTLKELTE